MGKFVTVFEKQHNMYQETQNPDGGRRVSNSYKEDIVMSCFNFGGNCCWIIILILLFFCCGNGGSCGMNNDCGCGNNNGCGCGC